MWFWLKEREAMFAGKVLTGSVKLSSIIIKTYSLEKFQPSDRKADLLSLISCSPALPGHLQMEVLYMI